MRERSEAVIATTPECQVFDKGVTRSTRHDDMTHYVDDPKAKLTSMLVRLE